MCRKLLLVFCILLAPGLIGLGMKFFWHKETDDASMRPIPPVGAIIDREHGITIHSNGKEQAASHGTHSSGDGGYHFGKKWQCVEFVKRYYYERFQHRMPDVWGHAKDFYEPDIPPGKLNPRRGLLQYRNGGKIKPKPEDILIFTQGKFGHVAIISKVNSDSIEIVQQNVPSYPRLTIPMVKNNEGWMIGIDGNQPAGWLRMPLIREAQD